MTKLTEMIENKLLEKTDLRDETKEELDKKLVGFLEAANETCQVTTRRAEVKLTSELDKLKSQVAGQESRLQSQIDHVKNSMNDFTTTRDDCQATPKWVDMENIKNACKQHNTLTMNDIQSLKEDLYTTKEQLEGNIQQTPKWGDLENIQNICKQHNASTMNEIKLLKEQISNTQEHNEVQSRSPSAVTVKPPTPQGVEQKGKKKIVILTDSNGKRLNQRKFCHPIPLKEVTWEIRYTLDKIQPILQTNKLNVHRCVRVLVCGSG